MQLHVALLHSNFLQYENKTSKQTTATLTGLPLQVDTQVLLTVCTTAQEDHTWTSLTTPLPSLRLNSLLLVQREKERSEATTPHTMLSVLDLMLSTDPDKQRETRHCTTDLTAQDTDTCK